MQALYIGRQDNIQDRIVEARVNTQIDWIQFYELAFDKKDIVLSLLDLFRNNNNQNNYDAHYNQFLVIIIILLVGFFFQFLVIS